MMVEGETDILHQVSKARLTERRYVQHNKSKLSSYTKGWLIIAHHRAGSGAGEQDLSQVLPILAKPEIPQGNSLPVGPI